MAQLIKILPEFLAKKIAAGEVVQRPASVVKELIENSIDASATSITILIRDGGKILIQVIDNGNGLSEEDVSLAFERHATSKISTYEDLENIRTLGFRGEALSSIAAISQVEMLTRQMTEEIGTKIQVEGGVIIEQSKNVASAGTIVRVRNLFYNTPARRNFLKSNTTEYKHIYDVIFRSALSHPELSFKFISDDEDILDLHPTNQDERLKVLFGENLAGSIISFDERTEFVSAKGFLGKPSFFRKARSEQYLFLNGRYIINRNLNHAVFQAYEHLLEKGSFPLFIIFLTIDPQKVDVNVHPSKMEVKFDDEGAIYRFVLSTVRKAIAAGDLIPSVGLSEKNTLVEAVKLHFKRDTGFATQRVARWEDLIRGENHLEQFKKVDSSPEGEATPVWKTDPNQHYEEQKITESLRQSSLPEQLKSNVFSDASPHQLPLWQIHNKYIMVPIRDGVMIVDQHAAHERVLYERAVERFNRANTQSQQLLFPHTIQMSRSDAVLVIQTQSLLETLGFRIKFFGKTTVILDGVPVDVRPGEEGAILQNVIDLFKNDERNVKLEPRERLIKSYSCKAAIKAGDSLTESEMRALLDQLFAKEIPFVCPHGRPVLIKLSLVELDKRFGRT